MKEKKTSRIHIALIVLIIVLGAGLVFELYREGTGWLSREMGIKPKKQGQGYIIVPSNEGEMEEWDPYKEMDRIQRRMDQWFNRVWKSMPGVEFKKVEIFEPDVDFNEVGNEYVLTCDLPGMSKDEISVSVSGICLTISGMRNTQKEEKEEREYYYQERRSGYFKRTILLPGPVDENNVKADYNNGILTVRIPKRKMEEEVKPKKVQII